MAAHARDARGADERRGRRGAARRVRHRRALGGAVAGSRVRAAREACPGPGRRDRRPRDPRPELVRTPRRSRPVTAAAVLLAPARTAVAGGGRPRASAARDLVTGVRGWAAGGLILG